MKLFYKLLCLLICFHIAYTYKLHDVLMKKEIEDITEKLNAIYEELLAENYKDYYRHDHNKRESLESRLPKNGELFEEDIVMDSRLRRAVLGGIQKKSAIRDESRKWENGVLPYVLGPSLDPCIRARFFKAKEEFHRRTCIRLVERTNEKDYVVYESIKNQCSSSIGRVGGAQNITLGKDCCILGTVEHETMHSLGFIHEHSRPDRDDYVAIKFENINEDDKLNFEKYTLDTVQNLDVPYNLMSIMHYRGTAFSKNGKRTIVPRESEDRDKAFGQRDQFSVSDVTEINHLYGCDVSNDAYYGLVADYTSHSYEMEKKRRDQRNNRQRALLEKLYKYRNLIKKK